jgi:3,4-dihydroxy 2-butanone 4-phosphate synthase / GTP cyclohydrolase II
VAVDAVGIGTGISAKDRSRTAQVLADPRATAEQLSRPGHVIPLRAGVGSDYVDAAVQLAQLAGQSGAAVVSRRVSEEDPTAMAQAPEIYRIASRRRLCTVTVAEILGCAARPRNGRSIASWSNPPPGPSTVSRSRSAAIG